MKFENIRKHWLWVFIGALIPIIIASIELYQDYQSRRHEIGGSLNASFQNRMLNNNDSLTVLVCMEDSIMDLTDLFLTPTFRNDDEFSIKDFYLNYEVKFDNVEIKPTSFVKAHQYGKSNIIFTYDNNILAAHDYTRNPFSGFYVKNGYGHSYIDVTATYDGASSAFEYYLDVYYIVVKNKNGNIDEWKQKCAFEIKNHNKGNIKNVYYCSNNKGTEYHLEISLPTAEASQNEVLADNSSPEKEKVETNTKSLNNLENHIKKEEIQAKESMASKPINKPNTSSADDNDEIGLCIENYDLEYSSIDTKMNIELNEPSPDSIEACLVLKGKTEGNRNYSQFISRLFLEQAKDKYTVYLGNKYKHIHNPVLYLKVNSKNYLEQENINNESFIIKNKSRYNLLIVVVYPDNSYYWNIKSPNETIKVNNNISQIVVFRDETSDGWFNSPYLHTWWAYILLLVLALLLFVFYTNFAINMDSFSDLFQYESVFDFIKKTIMLILSIICTLITIGGLGYFLYAVYDYFFVN